LRQAVSKIRAFSAGSPALKLDEAARRLSSKWVSAKLFAAYLLYFFRIISKDQCAFLPRL